MRIRLLGCAGLAFGIASVWLPSTATGALTSARDGSGAATCPGDCDGSGAVTVDELVRGIWAPRWRWVSAVARGKALEIRLRDVPPNTEAIGARIFVTAGGQTQLRELRAGSNFVSQDPAVAHFGLQGAERIDEIRVVWPDQSTSRCGAVPTNQFLRIDHAEGTCRPDL